MKKKEDREKEARREMVREQLLKRGIQDPHVLSAMRAVPRHFFVPSEERTWAYADTPLPIGEGQTISQPYIVAWMAEWIHPKPGDKVLEVGCGSGYMAAVLARLVRRVVTVEIRKSLAEHAAARLRELGVKNVEVRVGDGCLGAPDEAPFDAVVVSAALRTFPENLARQIRSGGVWVAPIGGSEVQEMVRGCVENGKTIRQEKLGKVRFVPCVRFP